MTTNRTFYPWQIIPQTNLEAKLLAHPEVKTGFQWASPAIGHPEKNVGTHVVHVLKNIDRLVQNSDRKNRLRLAAIVHDTFKYQEHRLDNKHGHGLLARHFMSNYTDDTFLLDLLEWHDEAYRAWVVGYIQNDFVSSESRIQTLINRFGSNIFEYQQFFNCDSKMMDKRAQPVLWFQHKIAARFTSKY